MASSAAMTSVVALKSKPGDDLLTTDLGKNDYDWLLTPPGTPLMTPSDHISSIYGEEFSSHAVLPNLVRSLAAIKTSRMPNFKSESTVKKELSNGTINHGRPDMGMRNARINIVRSNSTSGSTFPNNIAATGMTGRRTVPATSSRPTSRPTTPTKRATMSSTPASRPTTPTGRSRAPATATFRPETPTSRSRTAPAPLSRPSTPSGKGTATPFSRNTEKNEMQSSSKGPVSSRPTTPLLRAVASQPHSQSGSATTARSSSIGKQRPAPCQSNPSSRGSSPTIKPNAWQQLSDIPDFSLEPPPNLRTSLPSRPSSNSRGASVTSRPGVPSAGNGVPASLKVHPELQLDKAREISTRRPSSPLFAKGNSGPFSSFGEKQGSFNTVAARTSGRFDRRPNESVVRGTKALDKMMPLRNTFPSSPSPDKALSRPTVRPGTLTASRDIAGYGRSTPRKSTDLSMRQMEIRQNAIIGRHTSICNAPTSSLCNVRPAGLHCLANGFPMATSSNASSDNSVSITRDPEGNELSEGLSSEAGSKHAPGNQCDSLSSFMRNAHVSSLLGGPDYDDGMPLSAVAHSTSEHNQSVPHNCENGSGSDSSLTCRHGCVAANCDLCNMKIRLQKLNEKCKASLWASLQATEQSLIPSQRNGRI